MDQHQVARLLAAGRLLIGTVALAAPRFSARHWLGVTEVGPAVKVLVRTMGARDAALAVGALQALTEGGAAPWVRGAAAADAVDAVATLVGLGRRQPGRALVVTAVAGAAALAGVAAAREIDDSP